MERVRKEEEDDAPEDRGHGRDLLNRRSRVRPKKGKSGQPDAKYRSQVSQMSSNGDRTIVSIVTERGLPLARLLRSKNGVPLESS